MGSQKSIVLVNYAREYFACIFSLRVDMGLPGTIRVLLMRLQPCVAISRRIIPYVICPPSYVVLEHSLLLGEVSKLGKECQFLVEATRRHQEAQGGCGRGNPYTGL